jgi:DNA modification methylase
MPIDDEVKTHRSIEELPISSLKPFARNARTHSKKQIHQIAASIEEFGFTNPVLVDQDGHILTGHGRVAAAKELGWTHAPTLRIDHLSKAQRRAYVLADNRLAEKAGWDPDLLRLELGELSDLDLDFDLEITAFETAEIDALIDGEARAPKQDPADAVPAVGAGPAVTRTGDLWRLGDHLLFCGDSRDAASYATLMGSDRARLVFADPPYNVRIDGHVGGLGAIKHREFACASGEMSRVEFTDFLATVFERLAEVSVDGAIHYQCMDWRHIGEMIEAGERVYSELKNLCVWVKDNGGMGSFYRSRQELVFVWKFGKAPHVNTIELGKHGRYRTNVWEYAGVNTLKSSRMSELAMHPTVKPTALVSDAIKDASKRGDLVLDPFGGSGTTLIAAQKTGRRARLIEIDPIYCDVIIQRWQTFTGKEAVRVADGRAFDEAKAALGGDVEALADAALG